MMRCFDPFNNFKDAHSACMSHGHGLLCSRDTIEQRTFSDRNELSSANLKVLLENSSCFLRFTYLSRLFEYCLGENAFVAKNG